LHAVFIVEGFWNRVGTSKRGRVSTSEAILISASRAMSDEELLREVEDVVREHTALVFRIAYSVLRNSHDAEDAAQEVFLRVLKYRAQLAKVAEPKPWVAQIAWRVAVELRGRRRATEDAALLGNATSAAMSVEEALGDEQMQSLLAVFIGELASELRAVITLSTVLELNSREIGEVLGIPETTVRTRQMRARQALKQRFAEVLGKRI
jgi:RNA polymerase sigma-70 factor, ECF subfamily